MCGDSMGRSRRRDSEKVDGCLVALVVPVAVVCAFPILLVPIVIGVVLWITADIVKIVEKRKAAKVAKEFEEKYSIKNLLAERERVVQSIKDEVHNNVVVYNSDSKSNNTFSFNEILSICDDIENKLLEIEMSYGEAEEDNDELDSLYFE